MARRFRIAFPVLLLFGYSGWAQAQAHAVPVKTESAADNMAEISLGQSAVPLYGPWKFTVGDSPVDPVTHGPLWAEPGGLTDVLHRRGADGDDLFFECLPASSCRCLPHGRPGCSAAPVLLLLWIVIQGIRRQGLEGWLVLPAVVLLGISLFADRPCRSSICGCGGFRGGWRSA